MTGAAPRVVARASALAPSRGPLIARARRLLFALAVAASALAVTSSGRARDEGLTARLSCRPAASVGRVSCELEVEAADGRLTWVDALVLRAPSFARPLRARVGMRQATASTERRVRLPIVLVATEAGSGQLEVEARAVRCARSLCASAVLPARAAVEVGPVREARP
ncbi:MAG: hypothetical protein OZ928_09790 [Polyangiaceae bacterium]|nr:hypothetical protein [Polyangiaceae bacterium]